VSWPVLIGNRSDEAIVLLRAGNPWLIAGSGSYAQAVNLRVASWSAGDEDAMIVKSSDQGWVILAGQLPSALLAHVKSAGGGSPVTVSTVDVPSLSFMGTSCVPQDWTFPKKEPLIRFSYEHEGEACHVASTG